MTNYFKQLWKEQNDRELEAKNANFEKDTSNVHAAQIEDEINSINTEISKTREDFEDKIQILQTRRDVAIKNLSIKRDKLINEYHQIKQNGSH